MFKLKHNKEIEVFQGDRLVTRTFVRSGDYPIIRVFDEDRVLVDLNTGTEPRTLTLLRIDNGEVVEKEVGNYEPSK